jgi:DNA replication protein DnaC
MRLPDYAERLRGISGESEESLWTDDELIEIPPTDEIELREVKLMELQQQHENDEEGDMSVPILLKRQAAKKIGQQIHRIRDVLLPMARERDKRHAERNRAPNCWCLGTGGKGKRYLLGNGLSDQIEDQPYVFESYCGCQEGTRRHHADERAKRASQVATRRARLESLLKGADIPEHYLHCTLESYPVLSVEQRRTMRAIASWKERSERWLFLHGPVGRGKTALAIALARESIEAGVPTRFDTVPDLLARLKRTFGDKDGPDAEDLLDALIDVDMLVLDDIGSEKVTDWTRESLFRLIDKRKNTRRRTILTSNHTLLQLAERIGERTVSRIQEMAEEVLVDGPNLRLRPQSNGANA